MTMLFWWIKRKAKFILDNTLGKKKKKKAILQFQVNKEGCDCILFGYSFRNQMKVYRLIWIPGKLVLWFLSLSMCIVPRSVLISVVEKYTFILFFFFPKIALRPCTLTLPSQLFWIQKYFISEVLLNAHSFRCFI